VFTLLADFFLAQSFGARVYLGTMTPHAPTHYRARPWPEQVATVRVVPREDAMWSRPVFRPPPLQVLAIQPELPYSGTTQRSEPWAAWPRPSTPSR
jgi:hypothetical protein